MKNSHDKNVLDDCDSPMGLFIPELMKNELKFYQIDYVIIINRLHCEKRPFFTVDTVEVWGGDNGVENESHLLDGGEKISRVAR